MQSGDYYAYRFPAANSQSRDYCDHVCKLENSPSDLGAEPPFQNNIHRIFKPRPTDEHRHTGTQSHVKFVEEAGGSEDYSGKATESAYVKEHHDVGHKVHMEEDINTAAGDFIMRRHKTFEMQKLKSMKRSDQYE